MIGNHRHCLQRREIRSTLEIEDFAQRKMVMLVRHLIELIALLHILPISHAKLEVHGR